MNYEKVSRTSGLRIGTDDGDQSEDQAEISRSLEQAEIADRVIVQVADRAGAGLLLAAGGAQGAGVLGDADAVERFGGVSRSRQALGKPSLIGLFDRYAVVVETGGRD